MEPQALGPDGRRLWPMLERDGEREALGALLVRAVDGDGRLAVVLGPPGIGKTALLHAVRELGEARGARVLVARASELDRSFAFGVVRQLFERLVAQAGSRERTALLKGAARHALAVLGDEVEEAPAREPTARALHGLYWLTANLAGVVPLVLCVDDAHWCDPASLRWLVHIGRRLEGLRILIVVSSRPSEPSAEQVLLDALQDASALTVRPSELTAAAVGRLLAGALGVEPDVAFVTASRRGTGGNPLLVHELVRHLVRDEVVPSAAAAGAVERMSADGIAHAVRRRVAALAAPAGDVVRGVAILGDSATVGQVATLTGLPELEVSRAAVELSAVDVLGPGRELAFVHPLVRAAAYDAIPAVSRGALHHAAAGLLRVEGAEPESVARHLLLVEPRRDPSIVGTLLAAGRQASRRGAPEEALTYFERALAEPPPDALRGDVLVELGTAEALLRAPGFEVHLAGAITAAKDDASAAQIALRLADAHAAGGGQLTKIAAALQLADDRAASGSRLALTIEAAAIATSQASPALFRPEWQQRARDRLAQLEAGEQLDAITLCGLIGYIQRTCPPAQRSTTVVEGALAAIDGLLDRGGIASLALIMPVAFGLANLGRLAEAAEVLDAVIAAGRRDGAVISVCWALGFRAEVSYRAGRLVDAESEARAACELMHADAGDRSLEPASEMWINGLAAIVLSERGQADEADATLRGLPSDAWAMESVYGGLMLTARAVVRRALADPEGALSDLRDAGARFAGTHRNPVVARWRAPAALLLAARGDRATALSLAREELALAEEFALPIAIGVALVACGVAEGGPRGLELLRDAVDVLAGTEARLEHARALVELGAATRRSGTPAAAREPLRAGLDLATRCGAVRDAERAREELLAAGGRPRRGRRLLSGPDALTAGEHRVAKLAAAGLTNREIAERLYVTQAAVQWHLRNTFRKLDITARTELAAALDPDGTR